MLLAFVAGPAKGAATWASRTFFTEADFIAASKALVISSLISLGRIHGDGHAEQLRHGKHFLEIRIEVRDGLDLPDARDVRASTSLATRGAKLLGLHVLAGPHRGDVTISTHRSGPL